MIDPIGLAISAFQAFLSLFGLGKRAGARQQQSARAGDQSPVTQVGGNVGGDVIVGDSVTAMKVGEHSVKLEVIDNKLEEQGQQITQLNAQMSALAQFQGGIPNLSADHPIRQHSERARAHMREYRWAEAEKEIELALSESTTPSQRAALHNLLGLALHGPSNFDGALTAWGDSLLEARRIPDLREREEAAAANLGNIGTVLRIKGDLDGALKNSKDALTINERIGRPEGRANNLGNIGNVLAIKGDLAGALKYFNDALAINERIGSLEGPGYRLE